MANLGWGKCLIETTPSVDGAPAADAVWQELDTPKEDSTKVTPTAGTEKTATEEGGGLVDVRYGKNTYVLEFELFVKKGGRRPFEDNDGLISGEHAFRITPEDDSCEGSLIDRSVVRCEETFSTSEGKILKYVAKCLKPKTGKVVKPYIKTGA